MWRLKRTDIPGVPDAVRVSIEPADDTPVAVSAEALTAATVGPTPLTDAAVIAQLRQQLEARGRTVLRLQAEIRALSAPPAQPRPFHGCPGCAGLRKTIADLEAAAKADRRRITELQFADPAEKARVLGAPLAPMAET